MNYEYNPVVLTDSELLWLIELVKKNDPHAFYTWSKWIKEREYVKRQDKNECQDCKEAGRFSIGTHVHHILHLKSYPQYALMMWVQIDGVWQRQLITLCEGCHDKRHPERLKRFRREKPLTVERW